MESCESMDYLIKTGLPLHEVQSPWVRVDFDREGRPAAGFFVRRFRSLLINSRSQIECPFELRVPENGSSSITLKLTFRLSCPLHAELEVARRFYDPELTPKQMFEQYVRQAVREYVENIGREAFLNHVEEQLSGKLKHHLEPRLSLLTRLKVEILQSVLPCEVPPVISMKLSGYRVDLEDNCFGVPVTLSIALAVGQTASMRASAQIYAERQGELENQVKQWIHLFFAKIKSSELFNNAAAVEARLKTELSLKTASWGRVPIQLSLTCLLDLAMKSIEDRIDCWLADETTLTLFVRGVVWATANENGGSAATQDLSTRLLELLKVRACRILSSCTYFAFDEGRKSVLQRITSSLHDDAYRLGIGAQLDFRTEWDHDWLLRGVRVFEEFSGRVGNGGVEATLNVWLECDIAEKNRAPWRKMTQSQMEDTLKRIITESLKKHVALIELEEYIAFDPLKDDIEKTLKTRIKAETGLEVTSLNLKRSDDWFKKTDHLLRAEAPVFTVKHPRMLALQFEVQFRFIGTAVQSGSPFPVFPIDMASLTSGVEGCIRDYLSEIPPANAVGLENGRALRKEIERVIPQLVQKRYYANIVLLRWITLPLGDQAQLEALLRELIGKLRGQVEHDWERNQWIEEAGRLAIAVEKLGGYVSWIELSMYGIERQRLELAAPEPKQLPSSSEDVPA